MNNRGVSLPFLVFIIFTILKLTDNIDWSWWWVTSPLWIPLVAVIAIIGVIGLLIILAGKIK